MKLPPLHIPLGYRRPIHDESPSILLTTTVAAWPSPSVAPCVVTQSVLLVPETLPHLPADDHLLCDHLTSALTDPDLSLGDYRALLRRALKHLEFLEWKEVTPATKEDFLLQTEEAVLFDFSAGLDIWEGYQNDPASWENATHYRPQNLPKQ